MPGQYYDAETGLHYNGHRYYNPKTGRYISSDPIGLAGGLNTFGYAYNNPIMYIDPTGEYGIVRAGFGAISGGIGGYISGGWQGAIAGAGAGAGAGALVGVVNPWGANAVGAAAGAGVASLLGQGVGNVVAGNDVTDPCNYSYSATIGAALGGALGGPLGNVLVLCLINTQDNQDTNGFPIYVH